MAGKSPKQFHSNWPNVSDPTELPNVSGASIQDAALEVGDLCYSLSDTTLYYCTTSTLGAAAWVRAPYDASAIHDNEAAEINALTAKAAPVDADVVLIEDSESGTPWSKKKVTISNLMSGSTPGNAEILGATNETFTTVLVSSPQTLWQ